MCELWVRTQNKKKLLKIDKIYYEDIEVALDEYSAVDHDYDITTDDETLGTYSTEKRALEVLDEIQKLLVGDVLLFKNVDIDGELGKYLEPSKALWLDDKTQKPQIEYLHRDCIVYEMPEK